MPSFYSHSLISLSSSVSTAFKAFLVAACVCFLIAAMEGVVVAVAAGRLSEFDDGCLFDGPLEVWVSCLVGCDFA